MEIDQKIREKTIVKTSIIGIIGNILLVGFKATIGFIAHSTSLISDALNNLTDALSSTITIVGTKLSNKSPDRKHPYGHGRIEYIASTLIAALILIAGVTAIYNSIISIIDYFQNGTMPEFSITSAIIISVAVLVKIGLSIFFRIQGKRVKSETLKASGLDALFDAILSAGTLLSIIFSLTLGWYIEGYVGIAIGLFIIYGGINVLRGAFSSIIGERIEPEEKKKIMEDITSIPGVIGAYDLIINSYGPQRSIGSVHIGVESTLSAREIQVIEREINAVLYSKYNILMTVGIYVENQESDIGNKIRSEILNIIKQNKNILQLHAFFVDEVNKICTFDLVFSFDEKDPGMTIKNINESLVKLFPDYSFMIQLDKDFSLS